MPTGHYQGSCCSERGQEASCFWPTRGWEAGIDFVCSGQAPDPGSGTTVEWDNVLSLSQLPLKVMRPNPAPHISTL